MANRLNDDNFLIWHGTFDEAPFTAQANDDNTGIVKGHSSKQINPFLNDVATHGFDYNSLEITVQSNTIDPATYDPISHLITYWLDENEPVGAVKTLKYRWRDLRGNISNEATIFVTVEDRATAWRGLQSSYSCRKDANGDNTGMAYYTTLERYYTDDNTPYVPATTKPNDSGDPDYIPDDSDQAACPLPNSNLTFYVWNYVNEFQISYITLTDTTTQQGYTYSLSHTSTNPQPMQIQIPAGTFDLFAEVLSPDDVSVPPGMRLYLSPSSGGSAAQQADITDTPQHIVFNNFTPGNSGGFAGDLILNY